MGADWAQTGRRLGADWVQTGYRLGTDGALTGYRLVTDWAHTGHRRHLCGCWWPPRSLRAPTGEQSSSHPLIFPLWLLPSEKMGPRREVLIRVSWAQLNIWGESGPISFILLTRTQTGPWPGSASNGLYALTGQNRFHLRGVNETLKPFACKRSPTVNLVYFFFLILFKRGAFPVAPPRVPRWANGLSSPAEWASVAPQHPLMDAWIIGGVTGRWFETCCTYSLWYCGLETSFQSSLSHPRLISCLRQRAELESSSRPAKGPGK